MPRKLVLFFDGSSNDDNEANRDVWTNVARIRDLVAADSSTLWFYTAGVGAAFETYRSSEDPKPKLIKIDNLVEKVQDVLGIQYVQEFGMGKGTLDRVQLGYKWLCENFKPGDDFSVFGFSRGSLAARAFVGMVSHVGIIDRARVRDAKAPASLPAEADAIQKALGITCFADAVTLAANSSTNACRIAGDPALPLVGVRLAPASMFSSTDGSELSRPSLPIADVRRLLSHPPATSDGHPARLRFIGVYDTVPFMPRVTDLAWFDLVTTLPSFVDAGLHLMSTDEPRKTMTPILIDLAAAKRDRPDLNFEQMVVPGDHADCGGGWDSFPVPSGWTAVDKTYGPFRPIPVEFSPGHAPQGVDASGVVQDPRKLPSWLLTTEGVPPKAGDRGVSWAVPPGHALSIVSMNTMLESARAAGVPLKDAWRLTPQSLERLTRKGVSHSTWHCARSAVVDGDPYYREIVADQMTMHPAVLVRIAEESAAYHPDNPVVDSVVQPSLTKAAKHATDVATIAHSPSSLALMAPGWASSPPFSAVCAKVSSTSAKTVTPVVLSKLRRPLNSLFLRVVRRRDNFPDSIAATTLALLGENEAAKSKGNPPVALPPKKKFVIAAQGSKTKTALTLAAAAVAAAVAIGFAKFV